MNKYIVYLPAVGTRPAAESVEAFLLKNGGTVDDVDIEHGILKIRCPATVAELLEGRLFLNGLERVG